MQSQLRRGRSLLVLTQDNQYKLSSPPADPHGLRSPSRDPWKAGGAAHSPQSPKSGADVSLSPEHFIPLGSHGTQSSARHQPRPVKRFSFRAGGNNLFMEARNRQLSRRLSSFGATEGNLFGSLATNANYGAPSMEGVLKDREAEAKVHLHSADLFERVNISKKCY